MSIDTEDSVEFETTFRSDRTIITIEGKRDVAVVVRSKRGERIYLPPEDVVKGDASGVISPYHPVAEPADDDEDEPTSPYERTGDDSGSGSPAGIRIVHPERATDVRVLR